MVLCPQGHATEDADRFCSNCGDPIPPPVKGKIREPKEDGVIGGDPILVMLMAFFIPTSGQFYNGHWKKALVVLVLEMGLFLFTFGLGWFAMFAIHMWSVVDAYKVAKARSAG